MLDLSASNGQGYKDALHTKNHLGDFGLVFFCCGEIKRNNGIAISPEDV
jgi:hypothetical protein